MGDDLPDYQLGISILAQALANLTSVVTASALDIRALTIQDKPFIGIPYNTVPLTDTFSGLVDNADDDADFDHSDWGSGLAWVTYAIIIRMATTVEFNTKKTQGFRVDLLNRASDYAFRKYFPAKFWPALEEASDEWWIHTTIFISNGFYSTSGQTLRVRFRNETGQALTVNINVLGVTV